MIVKLKPGLTPFLYVYRYYDIQPDRHGQRCAIKVGTRSGGYNCIIVFEDGAEYIVPRAAICQQENYREAKVRPRKNRLGQRLRNS